jgi:hypothetical protein
MKTKYTVDYFIEKFSKIPDKFWCKSYYTSYDQGIEKHCALGHCGFKCEDDGGENTTKEGKALIKLIITKLRHAVSDINDGTYEEFVCMLGDDPKTRIINALKMIKEGKKPEF